MQDFVTNEGPSANGAPDVANPSFSNSLPYAYTTQFTLSPLAMSLRGLNYPPSRTPKSANFCLIPGLIFGVLIRGRGNTAGLSLLDNFSSITHEPFSTT